MWAHKNTKKKGKKIKPKHISKLYFLSFCRKIQCSVISCGNWFHNWNVHFFGRVFWVWTSHCWGSSHCMGAAEAQHCLSDPKVLLHLKHSPDTNGTEHPQLQHKLFQASRGKLRLIYAVASRNDWEAASDAHGWSRGQRVCQHSPFWVQTQKQGHWQLLWNSDSTGSHLSLYMDSSRITVLGTESLFKECTMNLKHPEIIITFILK